MTWIIILQCKVFLWHNKKNIWRQTLYFCGPQQLLFLPIHFLFVGSLLSINPILCFSVTLRFKTRIGGVPRWNNEIRGISFITDFAILFQSPLFARAAKGPEIQADQSSYQLTPNPLLLLLLPPSPLIVLHNSFSWLLLSVSRHMRAENVFRLFFLFLFISFFVSSLIVCC